MRIVDVQECSVPISRYADSMMPSGGLTTSIVALTTDVERDGKPIVGYGFSSFGRYSQSGLIRERFAPRLLASSSADLANDDQTNIRPDRAWRMMMADEKPGGHGERCVAVGTLDMALWDAAAKIANQPLYLFLADHLGRKIPDRPEVAVYASGGYPYPENDLERLQEEVRQLLDQGFTRMKIKIGAGPISRDLRRIDAALEFLASPGVLAVDAMNRFDKERSLRAALALAPRDLWWFEDICDPLDFNTQASVAQVYGRPIAAGETLFSLAEAKLLNRHGGLVAERDILLFDPVHCYGLTHYLSIVEMFDAEGWSRKSHWPHGGHLFSLHIACALGLGGSEVNPFSFQPFGGLSDASAIREGFVGLPDSPGIGLESRTSLIRFLHHYLH